MLWTLVGYSLNDTFMIVPNAAGAVLSVFQLLLVAKYGSQQSGFLPVQVNDVHKE